MRFKIDFYNSTYNPFALYVFNENKWFGKWEIVGTFETKNQAEEFYNKVKDLPKYLE